MENKERLKRAKSELRKAQIRAESIKIEMAKLNHDHIKQQKICSGLEEPIEVASNGKVNIKVTDHAIVRYMERVMGVDIVELESKIVTSEIISLATKFGGSGVYPIGNHKVRMKGNTIITII